MLLCPLFKSLVEYFALALYFEYRVHTVYLIKMKVLTYTSYKEHCELYSQVHGSIAVESHQTKLARKYMILLSNVSVIFYKAGSRTGMGSTIFIKFSSLRVLIQLMILTKKSRQQSYKKDRTGNHLKLNTQSWSYQNATHLWPPIFFYCAWYTRQTS